MQKNLTDMTAKWPDRLAGIPALFQEVLGGLELPESCSGWFWGTRHLNSIEDCMAFFSMYVLLLEKAGLPGLDILDQFSGRTRIIHQSAETKALATWFKRLFVERASPALVAEFEPLQQRGLTLNDIAETMLHAGMQMQCLTLPKEGRTTEADESVPSGTNGDDLSCDVWPDTEPIRLACDGSIINSAAKFVFKQLQPHEYDLVLRVLHKTAGLSPNRNIIRTFLTENSSLISDWHHIRERWLQYFFWFQSRFAEDGCKRLGSESARLLIDLKKSIRILPGGIEFLLPASKEGYKFRIDCDKGGILGFRDGQWKNTGLHFVVGSPHGKIDKNTRGRDDILLRVLEEFQALTRKARGCALNRAEHQLVSAILGDCGQIILQKMNAKVLNLIRALATEPRTIWLMYGAARTYGVDSGEFQRIKLFQQAFPTCFMVLPVAALENVVIAGNPIRGSQWFPYWSRFFREASTKWTDSWQVAEHELEMAVALTLGVRRSCLDRISDLIYVLFCLGLKDPFTKLTRCREAFITWALHHCQDTGKEAIDFLAELKQLADFCEHIGWICNRDTTWKSLYRRYDEYWFNGLETYQKEELETDAPFLEPWLKPGWSDGEFEIRFCPSPSQLNAVASEMQNCLWGYLPSLREGQTQIYTLNNIKNDKTVAAIALTKNRSCWFNLLEARGPQNKPLDTKQESLIRSWFENEDERGWKVLDYLTRL